MRLAKGRRIAWFAQISGKQIDDVRVLAMVARTNEDGDPKYHDGFVVDRWEIPIIEVRSRVEDIG